MVKALAMLSGGLDSTLAVKMILDQGVEVIGAKYTTPFCQCDSGGKCHAAEVTKKFGLQYKPMVAGEDYLKMLANPKHGYGSGMNPCIDCRILMLKRAKALAKELGAKFIFTGEVLGQRPMSQQMKQLKIIEKEADLEGKILRPLSAKLLPPTEAEEKGWVDREKLLAISGRSRKPQIQLAKDYKITDYPCPAGGCLLTDKVYAAKLRDFLKHNKELTVRDCLFLKLGRHFRLGENKIVVGRKEEENKALLALKNPSDLALEAKGIGSPTTILQGKKTKKAIEAAAALTARYSDAKEEKVRVSYGEKEILIKPASENEVEELRITSTTHN